MSLISFSNVSKTYRIKRKTIPALTNVSFTIEKGSFTILSGPSGSGKSTILQILSGIEPADSGRIIIDNYETTKFSNKSLSAFRRKKIGIIFQQFYLEPTLTLRHNMELPAIFFNIGKHEREQRTAELSQKMGLSDHLSHLPSQLSGGQIQRAAIARAIYAKPEILIADEPTSNLDQDNMSAATALFQQIQQTYGTTIIIATHDTRITQFADQIIELKNGEVQP